LQWLHRQAIAAHWRRETETQWFFEDLVCGRWWTPDSDAENTSIFEAFLLKLKGAYYSVPPEFLGQRLWARWDGRIVRLLDQRCGQRPLGVSSFWVLV
jgi:hypothetical protein